MAFIVNTSDNAWPMSKCHYPSPSQLTYDSEISLLSGHRQTNITHGYHYIFIWDVLSIKQVTEMLRKPKASREGSKILKAKHILQECDNDPFLSNKE